MSDLPLVLTRDGLRASGRGHDHGDRRVRNGLWVRAAPSTYVTGSVQLPDRVHAALAHTGPDAVVTGWAACRALDLPYVRDGGAVPVLVPPGRRRVSTPYVRVLPTTRPPAWWRWHGDVRVAAPARSVVDAARDLPDLRSVRALVLGAAGTVRLGDLREELETGAKARSKLCRQALADLEAGAASAPEAEVADHAAAAARAGRLPPFLLNPDVLLDGRFLGRPDGWLLGVGLGWEVDSREHHAGEDAFERTLARSDRFLAGGLSLLHLTPRRVRALGAATGELLVAAAAARRASRTLEPVGLLVVPRGPLLPLSARRERPGRAPGA